MKRMISSVVAIALVVLFGAAPAMADFGFKQLDFSFTNQDGTPATQAGSHPFAMNAEVEINSTVDPVGGEVPDQEIKDLIIQPPPGFVGDATAMPRCSASEFFIPTGPEEAYPSCSDNTAVGFAAINGSFEAGPHLVDRFYSPVYNLVPPPGVAAKFGLYALNWVPITVEVGLNEAPPYNIVASARNASQSIRVYGAGMTLWGNPGIAAHDSLRGQCLLSGINITPSPTSLGTCPSSAGEKPFLTLPRSCTGPVDVGFESRSWQNPSRTIFGSVTTHDDAIPANPQGMTGCGKLGFSPTIKSQVTTNQAETGTGFDFDVNFNDEGLTNSAGLAQSDIKKAEVTLPDGVTINPSIGEGLSICTPAEIDRETLGSAPGEGCPNASKIGSLNLETPIVEEPVSGSVFLAQQDNPDTTTPGAENPFDSLIALYLVLKNPTLGAVVKLPLRIDPDPRTGRLVATLEDVPQLPFSHFNFHFREGARAALVTPSACGTYTTKAVFTPWANPDQPLATTSDFEITRGVGGGTCPPGGVPPFHPDFEAGSLNNNAGSFSPFNMRLIREDGEQDMTKFSSILPPGELGSLAGVDKCSDTAIDIAKSKTGRKELASPSCPANSLIGHTLAGAGVGGALTYVKGQLYLGGPYKGDPLSVVSVTPAVAGPFDAGTVVVRLALTLNPKTAEVEVDGAASDPIPHILKGIVLKLRDLRIYVDRPNFTLNPTSCDESSAKATLFGSYLDVFSPADDVPAALSTRYQAANCQSLGYKPGLSLKLKGGTKRGGHPGLLATYRARKGDANTKGIVVRLPRSAFLDQAHIRTICTRVQFAADACPPAARYGYIKAYTPLLDEPLEGPVWLRSSDHKLPDLVFDLHGLVDVEVSTRIDSARGGIRASIEDAPDAPLNKVVLRMQGGKKGLIINSRNLCGAISRANVEFEGQNGKESKLNPVMKADCGGKRKAKRRGA
jgi:hypothetical protein